MFMGIYFALYLTIFAYFDNNRQDEGYRKMMQFFVPWRLSTENQNEYPIGHNRLYDPGRGLIVSQTADRVV